MTSAILNGGELVSCATGLRQRLCIESQCEACGVIWRGTEEPPDETTDLCGHAGWREMWAELQAEGA